ncbi:MAG: sulfatase-like hydrolase/transferase [Deltaproteobacteria bacterium]|nr:sulfatase-like hydrolase/transferase [Deltaproteobacteria bacterium]MBN2674207.1 sulfatase-like hydrolase/transferase [Deltaproteobacteria bacterium]
MRTHITKWMIIGMSAGILLGIVDALALLILAPDMFLFAAEKWLAILFCVAINAMAGAVISPVGAIFSLAVHKLPHRGRVFALSALYSIPLIVLTWLLTSGPQASAIPGRPLLVTIAGVLTGSAAALATIWLANRTRKKSRILLFAASIAIAFSLLAADLFVLVRLYLPFHIALSAIAWLILCLGTLHLWRNAPKWWVTVTMLILFIAASTGGLLALSKVRRTQNTRFVIREKTATATDVVLAAKRLIPPAEQFILDEEPTTAPDAAPESKPVQSLKRPGASVLFVTVDAMRYDRIIPGKTDGPAPTINTLAENAVVFQRAYTALPHTSYAVASFLTGKYIKPLFDIPEVTADQETWADIMRRFRYRTGGFFTRSVFFIDRAKFKPLENKGYGFGYLKMEYRFTAEQKVDQALEFLDKIKDKNVPMFTWVHLFEAHEPYKPECTRFGAEDEQRYDCEIYTADHELKRLFAFVEEYFPDTIIVVAADHGEEFGDHGGKYHGTTLYDEQARVPLVIRVPGVEHRMVDEPVNLVDILGTVLSIVDIPVPPRVRSNNLSGLIQGTDTEKKAAFSQLHERRMVVYDNHKLIWDQASDLVRLYDLKNDPKETISIADRKPKVVAQLKKKIAEWEATHAKTELRPVTTEDGVESWPLAVQKALGGDTSAANELSAYIGDNTPEVVRHKAAELLYEMWMHFNRKIDLASVSDPVCLAWMWSAMAAKNETEAVAQLQQITPSLNPHSAPWARTVLTRLTHGDTTAVSEAIEIAQRKETAPAVRIEAIRILGKTNARQAVPALMALLDTYQLRLAAVEALTKLKAAAATPSIRKYLAEETFISRRSDVTSAIAQLEGKKAAADILAQLVHEKPITNGLQLLHEIGILTTRTSTAKSGDAHIAYTENNSLTVASNRALKLFLRSPSAIKRVAVQCNGTETAVLNNVEANVQIEIPLDACKATDSEKLTISLSNPAPPESQMAVVY